MREFRARIGRVKMKGGADLHILRTGVVDIPALMRNTAQEIEDGKHGHVEAVAAVALTSEGVAVFGWGADASPMYGAGLLGLGVHELNSMTQHGYVGRSM